MRKLGIYIHIPFCVKKCRYCDFLSFPASEERKQEYVRALLKEIERESVHYKDFTTDSVFIGGGTPSVLPEGALEEILDSLRRFYRFSPVSGKSTQTRTGKKVLPGDIGEVQAEDRAEPEITVEVNPGTVNRKKLESYRRAGVNRISIGTQSIHENELAYLGRIHTAGDFFRTYWEAQEAGITNINVDIMAALPGQSVEDYKDNLVQIAGCSPADISAYSLIIEEGTPFYELYNEKTTENIRQYKCNKNILPLPSEEEERVMYEMTDDFLREKGYYRYEISNYAIPGRECRHNIAYWKRQDYAGFGVGASSMVNNVRWKNLSDMDEYIRRIAAQEQQIKQEINWLSIQEQMEEFMFLGLRLTEGIGRKEFQEVFGRDVDEVYGTVMEQVCAQGLLETEGRIRLTDYGRDISNYVMAQFLFM